MHWLLNSANNAKKTVKLPLVHPFKSVELDNSKEKTRHDNAINACSNLKTNVTHYMTAKPLNRPDVYFGR